METFTFNTVELILLSVAGILFIIQLIYYFGLYNRIHVHNKAVGKEEVHFIRELPPLSVILVHAMRLKIFVKFYLPFWNRTIHNLK